MRRMSFSLTTDQIRARTKDVTRRAGWSDLKPGERFLAVEKAMGLRKGQKHSVLATLECVSNVPIPLNSIDAADVRREGFTDLTPAQFVRMYCNAMRAEPSVTVNRIEFKYVEGA